jgi:hypothetical protein
MKKLLLTLAIAGLFVSAATAGTLTLIGPEEGQVVPEGRFSVEIWGNDIANLAGGDFAVQFTMEGAGTPTDKIYAAVDAEEGNPMFGNTVVEYNTDVFGFGIFPSWNTDLNQVSIVNMGGESTLTEDTWLMTLGFDYSGMDASYVGTYTIDVNGNFTELSDGLAQPIAFDVVTGTVNIVPEPATLALLGMGVVGLIGYRRRKNG